MAVLFLPIAFGMHSIYEWSHAGSARPIPVIQAKALYLNVPFFLARQAFYFIVWNDDRPPADAAGRPSTIAPAIRR